MRLLLDTHVLLWWLADDPALPPPHRAAIADPASEVFVSAASTWEIAIKQALGKLEIPMDELAAALKTGGFRELPITMDHAIRAGALPRHHSDPFDRMLVAQAQQEGLTIATVDQAIGLYAVASI